MIGLEPTAADARFVASIEMVDGVPKVTWLPDLGAERVYLVYGCRSLLWGDEGVAPPCWEVLTEESKGDYNFFKVAVEMP